jgi:hypothetical protein
MKLSWFKIGAAGVSVALAIGVSMLPQAAQATPSLCGSYTQIGTVDGHPQCQVQLGPASAGNYTNAFFVVPANVSSVSVDVIGGSGIGANAEISGGKGAEIKANLSVNANDILDFSSSALGGMAAAPGYCNNGAVFINSWDGSGGAYGLLKLRSNPSVKLIAGAGGGGGCGNTSGPNYGHGGNGGDASLPAFTDSSNVFHAAVDATAGQNWAETNSIGGGPGTQSAGGAGGAGDICAGNSGTSYTVGSAGGNVGCNSGRPGGGGGGGYYGGGAGGSRGAGGGGGSSFVGDGFVVTDASLHFDHVMGARAILTYVVVPQVPSVPRAPYAAPGDTTADVTVTPAVGGPAASSYTITADPGGQTCTVPSPNITLTCTVTGLTDGTTYTFTATATNENGTSSASPASDPIYLTAYQVLQPNAAIEGVARTTQVVHATGTFDAGVTLSYQWYIDGDRINGATNADYTIASRDVGLPLEVKVTSTKSGYYDYVTWAPAVFPKSDKPTISGSFQVGSTLTSDEGLWPVNTSFTYQWRANGVPIVGANSSSIDLTPSQVGKRMSLLITGTRTGYASTSKSASSSTPVAPGQFQNVSVPTISGTYRVGQTLTADAGVWDSGVTLTYKWFRDGVAIPGATTNTYTLLQSDGGKGIAVRVSGAKPGFAPAWRTTPYTSVPVLVRQTNTDSPSLSGRTTYGRTLRFDAGSNWDVDSVQHWIWLRNGAVIAGTNDVSSYTLGLDDIGKRIAVRLTSTEPGTFDETRTVGSQMIAKARFLQPDSPYVYGTARSGEVLGVDPGFWDENALLSYQWYSNGRLIDGATDQSYRIASIYAGTKISVKITGTADGYFAMSVLSSPVSVSKN